MCYEKREKIESHRKCFGLFLLELEMMLVVLELSYMIMLLMLMLLHPPL